MHFFSPLQIVKLLIMKFVQPFVTSHIFHIHHNYSEFSAFISWNMMNVLPITLYKLSVNSPSLSVHYQNPGLRSIEMMVHGKLKIRKLVYERFNYLTCIILYAAAENILT
jgi:hypothetical protein